MKVFRLEQIDKLLTCNKSTTIDFLLSSQSNFRIIRFVRYDDDGLLFNQLFQILKSSITNVNRLKISYLLNKNLMIHIEHNFHARETPTRTCKKRSFTYFSVKSFARSVDSNGRLLMSNNNGNNMRLEILTQTYRVHVMTNNFKCIKSISRV